MSELKNCPFCGGEAEIEEVEMSPFIDESYIAYSAGCKSCNIGWFNDDREEAITAWNRRADHWIPASNPPKTSSDYLVETGSKRPFSAFYAEVANMWVKGDENIHPTHWQPLPPLPEGVKE